MPRPGSAGGRRWPLVVPRHLSGDHGLHALARRRHAGGWAKDGWRAAPPTSSARPASAAHTVAARGRPCCVATTQGRCSANLCSLARLCYRSTTREQFYRIMLPYQKMLPYVFSILWTQFPLSNYALTTESHYFTPHLIPCTLGNLFH